MKFFFADSQDLVDPSFDFATESRSEQRLRHRDDQYAHEVFSEPPDDGILVSRAIVEGQSGESGRYTVAQRQRLLREGAREFFRLNGMVLQTMGDCGAFSYVAEESPPVTVEEVIDFYEACGFDCAVSVDHIILAYQPEADSALPGLDPVPEEWVRRRQITLDLAQAFLRRHNARKCRFTPIGVAQGWSPRSYADSVKKLQKMGYRRIALGGMVPLKTHEVLQVLEATNGVRKEGSTFHLFGVTRCEQVLAFKRYGVTSFDSTSPLKHAFKHDRRNYFTPTDSYSAVRVPQVEGNAKLERRIRSGEVDQAQARKLETACLTALAEYDLDRFPLDDLLNLLRDYECIHDDRKDRSADYRRVLGDRPWRNCPCDICQRLGIHVVSFRGAERNRRRGFHNLFVVYRQLHKHLEQSK